MGRPKITTGLDKVRREIDIMKDLWHPNILVLEQIIDDPDEDPLILVLEYAAKGQIMAFDSKTMRYKKNVFAIEPSPSPSPTAPASSASATATPAEHDAPIPEAILRKLLADVLDGLEYRQCEGGARRSGRNERLMHAEVKFDADASDLPVMLLVCISSQQEYHSPRYQTGSEWTPRAQPSLYTLYAHR
jgi:serine/threonine protein kinase